MKKRLFIAAATIAALMVVTIMSCNKEENRHYERSQSHSSHQLAMMDDLDSYLCDFKKQLEGTKSDETLSIEEAAWHLASLANYDFGYFNAEHNNIHMDTLYGQINVTEGRIELSDLAIAYSDLHSAIDNYFQKLDFDNKQIHFVDVTINENGTMEISISVTFNDRYHWWHYNDLYYCETYFDDQGPFLAFGNGMSTLNYVLNLLESFNLDPNLGSVYAVPTGTFVPLPNNFIDPYGSPNFIDSRIFCTNGTYNEIIPEADMCYYLQSYHALGLDSIPSGNEFNIVITHWEITDKVLNSNPYYPPQEQMDVQQTYYHEVTIHYGRLTGHTGGSGND